MKNNGWIVWLGTLALLLLHQDFWFWDNYETEVFGFMPIGLAYHAGFSIVAALWWGAVMSFAWPHHLEALAEVTSRAAKYQVSAIFTKVLAYLSHQFWDLSTVPILKEDPIY